jgi:hypothetical protein
MPDTVLFETMQVYREWCESNLPGGFGMAAFEYEAAEDVSQVNR